MLIHPWDAARDDTEWQQWSVDCTNSLIGSTGVLRLGRVPVCMKLLRFIEI